MRDLPDVAGQVPRSREAAVATDARPGGAQQTGLPPCSYQVSMGKKLNYMYIVDGFSLRSHQVITIAN